MCEYLGTQLDLRDVGSVMRCMQQPELQRQDDRIKLCVVHVMGKIGWLPTVSEVNEQVISDKNAELHKAIIPIVTAIFGPAAAASSIIIATLNGLESDECGRSVVYAVRKEEQ